MKLSVVALAALALAAPALGRDRPVPAATPNGEAIDCVQTSLIRNSAVRSDQVIDFTMRGGQVYRNTLDGACPRLGFEERFTYKVYGGRLCSTDIIQVLQSPGLQPISSCGLGEFQPVSIAKAAR